MQPPFTTIDQWLAWLDALQPERIELGLQRSQAVLNALQLNFDTTRFVTIAGTNGKGSTVAYLEAIYTQAGYQTCAYTSPHLLRYNERLRNNTESIDDASLCAAFSAVYAARDNVPLTYFEFGTLAALWLIARLQPHVALLEVGLGGRLDAVNIIAAEVAVITSIGLDHMDWLGDNREDIGAEKAGIARSQRPLICTDPQPPASIASTANRIEAKLFQAGQEFEHHYAAGVFSFSADWLQQTLTIDSNATLAQHQRDNAVAAMAVTTLPNTALPPVPKEIIERGNWLVTLPGRLQTINQRGADMPEILLDVAHNPQAAAALNTALQLQPCPGKTRAVLAMLADKDCAGVAAALNEEICHWYLAPTAGARGQSAVDLQSRLENTVQAPLSALQSLSDAIHSAIQDSVENDRIIVLGSFLTAADCLRITADISSVNYESST